MTWFQYDKDSLPYKSFIELRLRDSGIPVFVNRREDVIHGEDTGNGEAQQANCEMTSRTNPI